MLKKYGLRIQLTVYAAVLLVTSNLLLLALLYYNFYVSLFGFDIRINGEVVNYYNIDGFESRLFYLGIIIMLITTVTGTIKTYFILGKLLNPLQELSHHMERVDQENLVQQIEINSNVKEFDSLICSFNSMMAKIKEAFDVQKQFSAYIAHELRTPLAVIQTKMDIYQKEQNLKECDKLIIPIEQQINKLNQLVNKILELSEIQQSTLKELIPIDLLLEEIIEDLEQKAHSKNITLQLNIADDHQLEQHFEVIGDHTLLYQALFNIVENGIKYSYEGGVVHIYLTKQKGSIKIMISDTGCGIKKEDCAKIFQAFYRGENKLTQTNKGYGIGLAFSKKVIEHHRGDIQIKSQESGSTFEIVLKEV
ncbi:Signal transduction histidine kinase [Granulicatella balaenopterae]|uniref:histidine kinase n=1 Tax=Granulicatella balaenopterae TaxID=137733 RepID=A0A1H9I9I5_9LACT|nr:HAMP domain-containing sensor histidine kinase [Granulicatella balaenopterae]SEQ71224.1 Signal transduction histidine kinase [Granulicatella balaenopterae]